MGSSIMFVLGHTLLLHLSLPVAVLAQPNEVVIELNEKVADLQLTISKQQNRISQLEKDKKSLELKLANQCNDHPQINDTNLSNYINPLC